MTVTPLTVTLLVFGAATGLIVPWPVAAGLLVAIGAFATVDAWLVRKPPRIERRLPPVLSRGVHAAFTVEAPSAATTVYQPGGPGLTVVPASGRGRLEGELEASIRGRHRLQSVATRTRGPLGLGAWHHQAGDVVEIAVFPDLPAARRTAAAVRTGRFGEEGRSVRGPLGLGTEFESIRDYSPDDDFRHLNWRATARTGKPMSNTYRLDRDRDVICLIDHGRLMASPVTSPSGRVTRLDLAVDAVAAIAAVADEIGDRVGVVTFADSVGRFVEPRRRGGDAVLAAIYDLEPSRADSDYERAFHTVVNSKRAMVIILTDLLDEAAAAPLARALPVLARHHALMVAGVRDPDLEFLVSQPAGDLSAATKTAAAVELLEGRDRTVAALARTGATVIDVEPSQLSAKCVAGYLRAKRSARL